MIVSTGLHRIQDHLHVRVFTCDFLPCGTEWNTQNVLDSFWRFYWNDCSGASLLLSDSEFALEGERGYFVPAGVPFHCRNTCILNHFYIHFDVIGLSRPVMRELFAVPVALPSAPTIAAAVQEIASERAAGRPLHWGLLCRLKAMLFEGLALYLQTVTPTQLAHCGRMTAAMQPVLPALQYIEENPGRALTNRELAARCNLSERHFLHRFREGLGQTPLGYIHERRVMLAAQRLLFTDDSIERIAEESGFGNRFYFTRLFTRYTGVSPAAYRKSRRV